VREIVSNRLESDCIGRYDCTTDEIRLLHPEVLRLPLSGETALARIPPDELFDSLVMHEIAHAFFAQTAVEGAAVPIANQEYVASAMQMASLTESSRDAFLAAHPGPSTVRQAELNTLIAVAAPTLFAAKAWRHFAEDGHGCAFVGRLIRGEVSFALPPL
jgi:hypothetical protein